MEVKVETKEDYRQRTDEIIAAISRLTDMMLPAIDHEKIRVYRLDFKSSQIIDKLLKIKRYQLEYRKLNDIWSPFQEGGQIAKRQNSIKKLTEEIALYEALPKN